MKKYSKEEIRFLAIRTVGNFFVLSSILGMFLTFGPAIKNEVVYRFERYKGVEYVVSDAKQIPSITKVPEGKDTFEDVLERRKEVRILTPVDTDFGIIIPKIAANSKIVANIEAGDHDVYMEALRIGVAHAKGTYFPGQGGNIYLFAHSTDNFWNVGRYNAVFYLLKELEKGDEIDIYFQGVRHIYITQDKQIIEPNQVEYLTMLTEKEQLTLQTCYPPGTTLKRLIVTALPIAQAQQENLK